VRDNTAHTSTAHEKQAHAECLGAQQSQARGQAQRRRVFGVSPTTIQHNLPMRTTSQAQGRRGALPTAMQHNTPTSRIEKEREISNSLSRFSYTFSALGIPAKPNRDVLRNALLCYGGDTPLNPIRNRFGWRLFAYGESKVD